MEIDNNRISGSVSQTGGKDTSVEQKANKGQDASSSANQSSENSGDRVTLTGTAQQLQKLVNEVASQPVVDSQRVAAVRTAVEEGTFTVNPERIADSIINLELALTDAR